jgi:hypothetical protein
MKVWRCLALAGTRPINPTAQARAPGNNNNQDYWRGPSPIRQLPCIEQKKKQKCIVSFDEPFN